MTNILGIDPGSSRMGYGLIEQQGSKLKLVKAGTLEIKEKDVNQKLLALASGLKALLKTVKPDLVAVEKIFFSKNVKTAIEVAQARGIIILITLQNQIPLIELTPQQAKQAVTNYGGADKKAVAKMVSIILERPLLKVLDDTTDALALAIAASSMYTHKYLKNLKVE